MAILKPKEMAERLNVTVKTLQIWDKKGTLKAYRTPTNRRYYTEEQYLKYIGQSDKDNRKIAAYARVSTNGQKGDLKNQIDFIREYVNAKGIILDEVVTDIGSGLDYKRFVRLGYDWFETLCRKHNTEIVVLNNVETSPDQEMVGDIASIVDIFSCRLPGLRKYKSKIANDKSLTDGENNEKDSEEP